MEKTIAYSALEGSEGLVFGNTGIRAMFDDANELGYVYNVALDGTRDDFLNNDLNNGIVFDTSLRQAFTNFSVQYAGALAINKVELETVREKVARLDEVSGVIELSDDKSTMALDLSSVLWEDVMKTTAGGKAVDPYNRDAFEKVFYEQIGASSPWYEIWGGSGLDVSGGYLDTLALDIWKADGRHIFDRFHMRVPKDVAVVHLADRIYEVKETEGSETHVDVYVGLQDKDNIIYGTTGYDLVCEMRVAA